MKFTDGNIGQILSHQTALVPNCDYIDKRCVLLTAGTFNSMDGEVTITDEHLQKICDVYNNKIEEIKLQGRDPSMADYQPAQLDHSTSARDTVGRLIGPLSVGEINGKSTLFGVIRFLGQEAIEKVSDGRWTHLSVGIKSLESCELDEITVTPFPACRDAILFSEKGNKMSDEEKKEEKNLAEEKTDKEEKEEKKLTDDKDENDKKEEKKLSDDKDTDDKKDEKKLNDEKANDENEEDEKEEKEMSKKKLSAAFTAFKSKQEAIKLAMKEANLKATFKRLQAQAKILPAEMKKIDVARLAKSSQETIDAVVDSYELRQPLVYTQVMGTVHAINPTLIRKEIKEKHLSDLEKETRARFSSIPKKDDQQSNNDTNFSNNKPTEENTNIGHIDLWDEIVSSIKKGDEQAAKDMYMKMTGARLEDDSCAASEVDMKKLMADFASLEESYSEVVRLSALATGIRI